MLRCSTRSLGLLSRALAGQTQCHGTALATVKQHAHTSLRQLHTKQRIRAVLNEAVCPQQQAQQQQLLKLSRQITCSAAAASWSFVQTPADALLPAQLGYTARFATTAGQQAESQPSSQQPKKEAFDSLELTEEKINAITDQIPQRPVTIVEGTSYMAIIIAAFTVLGFFVYNFVTNFILEPTYQTCFTNTLQKLKQDPRITVRLGNDIVGYGQESSSRVQRQQIPHQIYKDNNGVEHVRLQFNMRGPGGVAVVNADMYKDTSGSWDYMYLLVDVQSGRSPPQRLNIVPPKLVPAV